jgi:CRISPR-associated protein Cas2
MFIILFYDISTKIKKNNYLKIKKIIEKNLTRIQKSIFEGNISKANLLKLENELKRNIQEDDQLIIYTFNSIKFSNKIVLGKGIDDVNIF